jgi:hypothetical protein
MPKEVEHEHQLIKTALDAASSPCAAWRQRPSAETGEALAASLDELNAAAQRRLDDEEQKVVPLAAMTLAQQEGTRSVALGRADPPDKTGIAFGMILEPLGEAGRAYMKSVPPALVPMLSPFLIERPWKKYASILRIGT